MQDAQAPFSRPAGRGSEIHRVGATLCGWTLQSLLGDGPLCESWLAGQGAERAVVRILRQPFAADTAVRHAWLRASWAPQRFHHPCVPKLLGDGVDSDGLPVVVRPWIQGESLDRLASRSPMDPRWVLQIAEQLLDALEIAHAHGIVHGAVAPSNVIVNVRRSVRLVDFAIDAGSDPRRAPAPRTAAPARRAAFVAPECREADGAWPSPQADIWSVGACLHFVLSGVPPHRLVPSLRQALPEVDPHVAAVLDTSLAPRREDRYASAYAMLGDVRRLLGGCEPRLGDALTPVPQSLADGPTLVLAGDVPVSSSRLKDQDEPSVPELPQSRPREWLGNLLLMLAIATLVGLATFVLVRERLADVPTTARDAR